MPFASSGDLPDPAIEPWSPTLQADSLLSEPPEKPMFIYRCIHLKAFEVHANTHICTLSMYVNIIYNINNTAYNIYVCSVSFSLNYM